MPQLNDRTVLTKEPYRSILNLLRMCSYLNGERIGLEHAHFLYALKNKSLRMNIEKENEVKQFFDQFHFNTTSGEGFNILYGETKKKRGWEIKLSSELKRGCITRPQRLNDALVLLKNKKWIEVEGKPKYRKYYLSRAYWADLEKRSITALLNVWDEHTVIPSESLYRFYLNNPNGFIPVKPDSAFIPVEKNHKFVLCGFPQNVIKNLSDAEKKNLNDWFIIIETYLWKIMELKYVTMKKSRNEYINKDLQEKKPVDDLIRADYIGFYYTARKSMVDE